MPPTVSGPPHVNEHKITPQTCEQGSVAHMILDSIKFTVTTITMVKELSVLIFKTYALIHVSIHQEF